MKIKDITALFYGIRTGLVYCLVFLFVFSGSIPAILAGNPPTTFILRTDDAPQIDGIINDPSWKSANILTDFRQYEPVMDADPRFASRVFLLYDDEAIYVAAILYDPHPDSIARQLGERDNDDLNADYFGVGFDTYNNQQDAYYFMVSASGIQTDGRKADETYDAVWQSAVKLTANGWNVEMRIPYSALRFPSKAMQEWGFQSIRKIRRYREQLQWALEEKGAGNSLVYWGKITGLENIEPPLRLSFTPYLSASMQHNSDPAISGNQLTGAYNGGMDMKYGLNESFTLDMILLPDFSQVQSDKIQKNLTALELIYDENRTFFNEGTDLFQKGNLFYSRRIGRTPLLYYSVADSLRENEDLTTNPLTARLLNAVKFSGRTGKGLGIGVFNALTGNTWARVTDTITGHERKVMTDPLTNYSIVVVDQALPNNSGVYFINTNVSRPGGWDDSNVTGGGATIGDKSKTYQLGLNFAASTWFNAGSNSRYPWGENYTGYNYGFYFMKSRGKFQFSIYQSGMDKHFNINDIGINRTRNQENRGVYLSYRIYEPTGNMLNFSNSIGLDQTRSIDSRKNINTALTYKGSTTFLNYLSVWWGASLSPYGRHDFYEPRRAGRYYIAPGYLQGWIGYSSDYRKKLALDGYFSLTRDFDNIKYLWFEIEPILRLNNRFSIRPKVGIGSNPGDPGYVFQDYSSDSIWFGRRDISTVEGSVSGKYMLSRKIGLTLWLRHYWQKAGYTSFYTLSDEGNLLAYPGFINPEYFNYNYNSFNIDMVLGWEFAPGSMLNIVWKNAIQQEDKLYRSNYGENLNNLFNGPQLNTLSVKVIYHLDYLQLKSRR